MEGGWVGSDIIGKASCVTMWGNHFRFGFH